MKFMILNQNVNFVSFSFYDDLVNPCLYLHLQYLNTQSAYDILVTIDKLKIIKERSDDGTKYLSQPTHLAESGIILLKDIDDIALVLNWMKDAGYLSLTQCEELASSSLQLFNRINLTSTKTVAAEATHKESRSEVMPSVSASSSHPRTISPEQHIAQAFAAVKSNNQHLLKILLGDEITEQERAACEKKHLQADGQTEARFSKEFQALVFSYQNRIFQAFLAIPETPSSVECEHLRQEFKQCIRDAKELLIRTKICDSHRPYLLNVDLTSIEKFGLWLVNFYEADSLRIDLTELTPSDKTSVQVLQSKLVQEHTAAVDSLRTLDQLRAADLAEYEQLNNANQHKEHIHTENIMQLLGANNNLPALYQYQTEAEKLAVMQLLQSVKIPINVVDEQGNTLLHWALHMEHRQLAIFLIQRGINETLRNQAQQTAHEFASKPQAFLLELQRIAHGEKAIPESQFLLLYKQHSDKYELSLTTDELWLQSPILRTLGKVIGLEEAITVERRQIKAHLDNLYTQALQTGNAEPLLRAIETLCTPDKTKRGFLHRSTFYDPLLALAQQVRWNPEMLGSLNVIIRGATLLMEQTLIAKDQEIARLTIEKATVERRNSDLSTENRTLTTQNTFLTTQNTTLTTQNTTLATENTSLTTQNSELRTELTTVKKSHEEQQLLITELRNSNQQSENRYSQLECKFESMMARVMQRLDEQQQQISQSLPNSTPATPVTQFFASPSATPSAATASSAMPITAKWTSVAANSLSDSQSVFPDHVMSPMDSNSVLANTPAAESDTIALSFSSPPSFSPSSLNKG